jgi:hypothetical protein
MVEFHSTLFGALLSGDLDLMWNGASMAPADRKERFRISKLALGTRFNFLPLGKGGPDVWASLDFKIQGTKEDLADSGTPGVAFSFLVSQPFGPVHAHLNFGWALFDGQQNFPSVPNAVTGMPETIRVDRMFFWGFALVLPVSDSMSFAVQSEGNTNGFKDLAVLDSDVNVLSAGFRALFKVYFIDLAGGAGITESSAAFHARLEIGMFF